MQFFALKCAAQHAEDAEERTAAGRALANIVSCVLDAWPQKDNHKTCVVKALREIKNRNAGFRQRWLGELHVKGVPKKRAGLHKRLEQFVQSAETRLDFFAGEVIHGMTGGEAPAARNEARVFGQWLVALPGVSDLLGQGAQTQPLWGLRSRLQELTDKGKREDVEGYFKHVFRPIMEGGLWLKTEALGSLKFGDYANVMQTILRTLLHQRDT